MTKTLPEAYHIGYFKSEAERLEKGLQAGDGPALAKATELLPQLQGAKPEELKTLAWNKVLLLVARDYGFSSWSKLKEHVAGAEAENAEARTIQTSYMPKEIPSIEGLDLRTHFHQTRNVGGDYLDVIRLDETRSVFVVMDINGKGLPSVKWMQQMREILIANLRSAPDFKAAIVAANRMLCETIEKDFFITAQVLLYDQAKLNVSFVSCGAAPLLSWRSKSGELEALQPRGIALGYDKEKFGDRLEVGERLLESGDRILLYSDGMYEDRFGAEDKEQAREHFMQMVAAHAERSSGEFVDELVRDLERDVRDDAVVVTFRLK